MIDAELAQQLTTMRQKGLSIKDIAKILGRTGQNVEYLLGKYGITKNKKHDILIGQQYGCWLVLSFAGYIEVGKSKSRFRKWNVQCANCHKVREVHTHV